MLISNAYGFYMYKLQFLCSKSNLPLGIGLLGAYQEGSDDDSGYICFKYFIPSIKEPDRKPF